jgi:YfiH family protein
VIETQHPAAPVPVAELEEWWERYGVVAGITERGADGQFSMGLWVEEPAISVHERWRAFRRWMAPRFPAVVLAHQVHGTQVRWHGSQEPGWLIGDGYDGHLTGEAGVLLTVTVADCVPIYLVDRRGRGLGLLHAGWKGVAGGMLEAGVTLLAERTGAAAADLAVHFGVAICGSCYEVGPEVARAVRGEGAEGKVRLDLRAELVRRAERLGIGEVTVSTLCASCDAERFFSHRRSGGDSGRMVAYLGRPRTDAPPSP